MSTANLYFSRLKEATKLNEGIPQAQRKSRHTVYFAVQGCCHGTLDDIYSQCAAHERTTGKTLDFLLCCGDFQAIRRPSDLNSMAVPQKYRVMGDFHKYFSGERKAPYLTLFVGGNHENSDWLAEESYGGYLCPNIYYVGHSGVVIVDDAVCVVGLSGIFKERDYEEAYPQRPFSASEARKREAYHVRRLEVEKLRLFAALQQVIRECLACGGDGKNQEESQTHSGDNASELAHSVAAGIVQQLAAMPRASRCAYSMPVHAFLSHDWPVGITSYGDERQLLRYKPYFEEDIRRGVLGNPHTLPLLKQLRPLWWFAAHLHCQFRASVPHYNPLPSLLPPVQPTCTPSDGCCSTYLGSTVTAPSSFSATNFLALDKCLGNKHHLEFMAMEVDMPDEETVDGRGAEPCVRASESYSALHEPEVGKRIRHHPLWLCVLKHTHQYLLNPTVSSVAKDGRVDESSWSHSRSAYSSVNLSPVSNLQQDVVSLVALLATALQEPCDGQSTENTVGAHPNYRNRASCTSTLLSSLHLAPAPLQQQLQPPHCVVGGTAPVPNSTTYGERSCKRTKVEAIRGQGKPPSIPSLQLINETQRSQTAMSSGTATAPNKEMDQQLPWSEDVTPNCRPKE